MAPRAYLWPSLFLGFLLFASETQARARVRRDGTENGRCHAIPGPAHGKVNCGDDIFEYTCTSTCDSGYQFTTRQSSIDRTCDQYSGEWYDGKDFPECVPVCAKKCANNGTCIGPNHCKCQNGWKGDYCEHYDPKCLQREGPEFGAIKCQNLDEVLFCQVSCNEGYTFESLPAVQYTCSQDTGWDPPKEVKIPNCIPIPTVGVPVTPGPIYTPFPVAATCVAWSQNHYRTFDNKVYSYDGQCTYELITDCSSFNAFSVHVTNDRHCVPGTQCKKEISIFVGGAQISLKRVNDAAQVKLGDDILNVPSSRDGFVFEQTGRFLTVRTQLGFQLKWDSKESIFVQVEKSMKKKICGLCGLYDGNPLNDFMVGDDIANSVISFAQYYKKAVPGEAVCPDLPQSSGCLTDTPANIAKTQSATTRCSQMNGGKFASCNSVIDPAVYIETCKSDCCKSDTASCMCNSFEAYARDCSRKQIVLDWRTAQTCPISCGNGMIYQECGSSCPKTCADPTATCSDDQCVDSCFCPEGTLYHDGSCFQPNQCPCTHEGKDYKEGEKIPSECNTCTCSSGKWSCTTHNCDKRCAATGDPHYLTFDGTPFDFMGTCSYYLLKDNNFDVIVDNIACGHGEATCTKSITLDYNGLNIKLDHNHELYVNGKAITRLPYEVPGIKIFMVSSLFMQAVLGNGITIFWDGRTRAYITAPPSFMRKTGGLCGFYDGKPTNDFKTPEGNTETNPNIFGNRWKTEASCRDVPSYTPHPCDSNPGRKLNATKECGILKNEVFQACHSKVSVDTYIENCMYDTCACQSNISECLCPNLAEYASQCAVEKINLNWRQKIPECAIKCSANQIYMSCGNPCVRSCRNIALNLDCRATCVEGCTCPSGYTLNDLSECIPISDCYCIFDNREYQPGFTTLKGKDLCQCVNARWSCRTFVTETNTTGGNLPTDVVIQAPCPSNMKYSDCVSRCPQTCSNLHDPPACNSAPCEQGCVCESGFVLESNQENAMCIPNNTCPCFHGGQKYYNGQVIKMDCSNCTCHDRKWLCNEVDCPAYCTSYGNSHYITFDGKPYNFQGNCDFILAKSTEFDRDQFQIITENVPCEGPGVTCSKAIEFTIGEPGTPDFYRLNLVRGKPIMVDSKAPFDITDVGNSVIVNTPGGISLSWDKGTTVYVQLSAEHMGKVTGLCGNFNGNPKDDFKGKLGGPTLSSAITFGDQWKVHDYCKIPSTIVSECEKVPARKPWAEQKCEILKSKVFEPCHSVVDYKPYLERCVFDVCACNMSGECESVCTDVAAYAHECAIKGTPIVWRTQELCYIECVDCEEYNPCITTCPEKTCDNHLHYDEITRECLQEACYEGCHRKPCPPGQVFDSNVEPMKCVSVTECQPACLIDSKKYREGERIFDKSVCNPECEVCTCKNGTLARYGFCSTATVTSTNVVTSSTSPNTGTVTGPTVSHTSPSTFSPICIHSGWTPYMSISTPTPSNTGDIETIDGLRSAYRFCNISMMEAIRCRVIGRDTMYDRSGQKVTCDLKDGLKCLHQDQDGKQLCYDYEVSYLCFCGETTAGITTPTGSGNGTTPTGDTITPTGSVPTPTRTPIPPVCYPGWTTWMDLGSPLINPKGDFELIKDLRYAYGFCMMPTSIRCRSATTHKSYHNTDDKNVQCDLKNGLQCFSDKQDKKICDNYEVSLHCECPSTATHTTSEVTGSSVATTNVIPPNATIITPTPGTPYTPIPSCLWTNWMNSYKKSSTNHGDYDTLSRLRLQFAFCKQPARIECRVAPSRKYPQGISYERAGQMAVTCDLNRGLVCEDFMQGPGEQCYDYEVRFYCLDGCSTPPIVTYVTPPFNPSNVSGQTPGVTPTGGTGKTPTPGTGNPSNVSGQTPGVTPTADTGKTPTPGTGKPSTVSGVTPGVTPTTGGTGQTPKPVCVEGWTPWINTDTPDTGTGDIESVFNLPGYPVTCKTQIGINCRLAMSHESYASTGQDVQCDPVEGLACLNTDFQKCLDYEVQFYCLCGSTTPPGTTSSGTPSIDTGSTTLNTGSTTPHITNTTPLNKDCSTPGWTTWMNVDKPGGPDGGDIETMDRLRYYNNFCGDKYIVGAKCRVEETGKDSETTGQKMTCDRKTGVTCLDSDQPDSSCKDYSIKFYCDCSVTTPSPPTTESTTDHKITGSTPQGTTIKECEYPMGLEHRSEITDVQFTASSSYDFSTEANQARLNNVAIGRMVGAWMPRFKDDQQWIQIDLLHPKNITGIVTQGRPGHNNWVKSYIVRTSLDGVNFIPITDFGKTSPLIFAGNSDHETPKTQIFGQRISARYVRVYPVTFETSIALRLEILGCFVPAVTGTGTTVTTTQTTASTPVTPPLNCVYPMGVDNNVLIKDYQLSASSYHGASYAANGRLFNPYGGWEPRTNYGYEWIQVDFLQPSFVSGVVTQGSGLNKKWVTKFFVETSVDGIHFLRYTENDRTRMFTGNSDQNSVVKNVFKNSFIARYVRIVPKEWSPYGVGLRFNIIGCLTPNIQTHIPTTPPTLIPVCQIKMGLENYRIVTDSQLTASSQIDKYHGPSSGRLTVVDQSNVSWVPKSTDTNRWIQVDFLERKIITGTIVQGGSENGWVSKYVVYYSNDGIHFTPYTESPLETAPKIFKGNQDGIKPVTNLFNRNIYARYVKLFPKSVHNAGGLKFNVIGCNPSIENNVSTPTTAAIITPEVTPTPYTGSPTPYTGPPTTAPIITPEVTPTPYTGSPTPYTGPPTTAPIITPEVTPTPYTGSPTPYTGPPTTAPTVTSTEGTTIKVCMIPMGVESRYVIHSYQLTASSQIDIAHGADQGRIYNTAVNEHGGAWVPLPSDKTPFIQVDFGQPTLVSGIITQGNPDKPMWIQTYKVLGSFDNKEFFPYSNTPGNVEPKTFNGNTDGTTPVQNLFNRNWLTRYIRIVPLDWTKSGASLRFNILGCTRPPTSVTISVPFIPPTIAGQSIPTYSVPPRVTGSTTEGTTTKVCDLPMGVENPGLIRNYQLTASTSKDKFNGPERGRLYTQIDGHFSGGWQPKVSNDNQWIQVDFMSGAFEVAGIKTQGNLGTPTRWVTKYKVLYSNGTQFHTILSQGKPKIFIGNSDHTTPKMNTFNTVLAQIIRIVPLEWHNGIGMRFNVYGCQIPPTQPPNIPTSTTHSTLSSPPTPHSTLSPPPTTLTPPVETTTMTPTTSKICMYYTQWVSLSKPDSRGDFESLNKMSKYVHVCDAEHAQKIECRTVDKKMTLIEAGQNNVKCDLQSKSLICLNSDQHGQKCLNYEIRFFCNECGGPIISSTTPYTGPSTSPTTPYTGPSTSPTTPYTGPSTSPTTPYTGPSTSPTTPYTGPSTSSTTPYTGPSTSSTIPCARGVTKYTDWVNKDKPTHGPGDHEAMTTDELERFCLGGTITEIECTTAHDNTPYSSLPIIATCTIADGFTCNNDDNPMPCDDFQIRYTCVCANDTTRTTPPISTTPYTGSSTLSSVNCVTSHWSEWINKDTPNSGDGDHEIMTTEELKKFCVGGDVTEVQCLTVENIAAESTGEGNTCNIKTGSNCLNVVNPPIRCHDYKIRYYCNCPITTTTPITTSSTVIPPPCGWSRWYNTDTPNIGAGDFETIGSLKNVYGVCKNMIDIECRVAGSTSSAITQTNVKCDMHNGLRCDNSEQKQKKCYDYEVRVLCWSEYCGVTTSPETHTITGSGTQTTVTGSGTQTTVTTSPDTGTTTVVCPPYQTYVMCAYKCRELCTNMLQSMRTCDLNDCVPGCRNISDTHKPVCPDGYKLRDRNTCVKVEMCPCLKQDGSLAQPFEHWINPSEECSTCHCFNNSVQCYTDSPCKTTNTIVTASTISQPPCHWTGWMNIDKPGDGDGDLELITELRAVNSFCESPMFIECRSVDGLTWDTTGQKVSCDLTYGLKCYKWNNLRGCRDYEVRFYCPCTGSTPSGITAQSTPPTPSTVSIGVPNYNVTCGWTEWINNHKPNNLGETELLTDIIRINKFCPINQITAIECREAVSKVSVNNGHQTGVICDLKYSGLTCDNSKQNAGTSCVDYEVRFNCNPLNIQCSNIIPTTPPIYTTTPGSATTGRKTITPTPNNIVTPPIITPSYPPPVCGGSMTHVTTIYTPDNQFLSSSSLSSYSGPERSRIGTNPTSVYTGAWVAKVNDKDQWIEVRFNEPHVVTNIRTQGREGFSQWIKAYKIEYSLDGTQFKYYEEQSGVQKIFSANFDDHSLVTQQLIPTTAKYIRLRPVSWNGAISLRFGVIGCEAPILGPCIQGWSHYVNTHTPTSELSHMEGGEHEKMTPEELKKFCSGGKVTKIECTTIDNVSFESKGDILTCTLAGGLQCENADNFPAPCSDYRVRYFCECQGVPPTLSSSVTPPHIPLITPSVPTVNCSEEMGMQNHMILDKMITASSFYDSLHVPFAARLGSATGWLAADDNRKQFLQVDFGVPKIISAITTQGRPQIPNYVTSYMVTFSSDGSSWTTYSDQPGHQKVFSANFDSETPVSNIFVRPIRAQYIRILPQTWHGKIALRMEIHGCFGESTTLKPITGHMVTPEVTPSPVTNLTPDNCILWDKWVDSHAVTPASSGDREPIETLQLRSIYCQHPIKIECRTATPDHTPFYQTDQNVECNLWNGLVCSNWKVSGSNKLCYNYEARLGCLKNSPECVPTPVTKIPLCYAGMDFSNCPSEGCKKGYYCDGSRCVTKSRCPCLIQGNIIPPGDLAQNSNCDTCQCMNGEVRCLSKTCPACGTAGSSRLNLSTCHCDCIHCRPDEFQCSNGECISISSRCDGIVDCYNDELDCANYTRPVEITTSQVGAQCVPGWSRYVNDHKPTSEMFQMEGGEHEKMTPEEIKKFCSGGKLTKIECTTINNVSSISNAEQLTCKLDSGLQCENADNFPAPCSDYRVRYFCHCEDQPTTSPKTQEPVTTTLCTTPTTTQVGAHCETGWSRYVNDHKPTSEMFQMEGGEHEKMTPEEIKKFCSGGKVTKIECTTINNVSSISNAEQLTCKLDSGLQCENADNFPAPCSDYRVRYFCHCEDQPTTSPKTQEPVTTTLCTTPPTTQGKSTQNDGYGNNTRPGRTNVSEGTPPGVSDIPTHVTPPPNHCETRWSKYVNDHKPTSEMFQMEGGEHEKMTPEELKKFCSVGKVTKIECTTINNVSSISNAEQLTCKLDSGLQCENADNFPAPCSDYRVRYYCDCQGVNFKDGHPGNHTTPKRGITTVTWQTPGVTGITPTYIVPTPCKVDKWSEYVNKHTPTSEMFSSEGGEHEKMTPEELKKFCPVGKVTKIECTTINNVSSISNAEQLTCKLDSGLQCENADNFPAPCSDYRVRYLCECPQICKDLKCPALVKPPLDIGEDVKIALTTDGCCRQYVKVCNSHLCPVSEENCETPKYLIQNGGTNCCPKFTCQCPDKCPIETDPVCLKGSKLIEIDTECNCKKKICVSLVPECRYRMTSLAELKSFKAGETWNDGLCKSCTCTKLSDGNVQTSCQTQQCSPCKPGEKKVTQPNKCCSDCQPIGCYMDGKIYKEGETMPSTLKCHSKQCIRDAVHGSFVVRESQTTCLALDKLPPCITDVVGFDSSGCCATCAPKTSNNTTDTCHSCQPKPIFTHPKQSVGYFTVTDNGEKCQNSQPISDLKLCSGSCDSSSKYTDIMSGIKNTCSCCQPTKTNVQNVKLVCSSGRTITKSYDIPETCACGLCSNS